MVFKPSVSIAHAVHLLRSSRLLYHPLLLLSSPAAEMSNVIRRCNSVLRAQSRPPSRISSPPTPQSQTPTKGSATRAKNTAAGKSSAIYVFHSLPSPQTTTSLIFIDQTSPPTSSAKNTACKRDPATTVHASSASARTTINVGRECGCVREMIIRISRRVRFISFWARVRVGIRVGRGCV